MNRQGVARWTGWVFAIAGVVIGVGAFNAAPHAQTAPAPEDVAAGFRIYRQKADCQACHGWAADGRKMDEPDARRRQPARHQARSRQADQAIKCGIPGKAMPAFDKFAYSDGRCYGMKQADLRSWTRRCPIRPRRCSARDRTGRRLLFAKVVGKGPMDHAAVRRVLGLRRRRVQGISELGSVLSPQSTVHGHANQSGQSCVQGTSIPW